MTAPELLLKAAKELAEYASYAEIAGGVSVNRPQVRRWCDAVFDIIRALPKDEWGEPTLASSPEVAALIAEARREAEEMTDGLVKASAWVSVAAEVLAGYNRDLGVDLPDTTEIGRIYESRDTPSFRITVGHIRILAAAIRALKEETP